MARVVFGMIANRSRPIGGVKVIYQAVAGLRRHGLDAYVLANPEMPPWLAGSRAVADAAVLDNRQRWQLDTRDVFVTIDTMSAQFEELVRSRPERRVIFVQNHNAIALNKDVDWVGLRHIRCLTVSEYSRRHLCEVSRFETVDVVPPGVDLELFRPAVARHPRVAFMPRKWPGLAETLRRRAGAAVEWLAIDGRSEAETAAVLASSAVFLNLGRGEGFGLPALEAMAAGCLMCGFAGQGTTDFATPDNGFWAGEGDVDGCARALEAALAALAEGRADRWIAAGIATAGRYALPVFEERMAAYFRAMI